MGNLDLRLELHDCRAVRNADITIKDMAVLCGPNACGKTTIAFALHDIVAMSASYDEMVRRLCIFKLESNGIREFIKIGAATNDNVGIAINIDDDNSSDPDAASDVAVLRMKSFDEYLDSLITLVKEVGALEIKENSARDRYFQAFLRKTDLHLQEKISVGDAAEQLLTRIQDERNYVYKVIATRDYDIYDIWGPAWDHYVMRSALCRLFEGQTQVFDSSRRQEPNVTMRSRQHEGVPIPIIGVQETTVLQKLGSYIQRITDKDVKQFDFEVAANGGPVKNIDDDFRHVMKGRIGIRKEGPRPAWFYHSEAGKWFEPLSDCASGIKNLSQLLIAVERGQIDSSTLLVLDEPESHLHPSWVVEYAKTLVKIMKELHPRILVTTHSPVMVHALWAISHAEGLAETVTFYMAEKCGDSDQYDYQALNDQIGPIFKDFNDAHRMIAEYEKRMERNRGQA